jgi:hypothetical protein
MRKPLLALLFSAAGIAAMIVGASSVRADNDDYHHHGRGWYKHHHEHERVYVAPAPVVVYPAPPAYVIAPPPPVYVPAPIVAPSINLIVPLRFK